MDIKLFEGKGTVSIDMLIIADDEGNAAIGTLESLNIDAIIRSNVSMYVFGIREINKENNSINIVKRAVILVEHIRRPRKNSPLGDILDTRFDYAKSIYNATFNCDDDIVEHLGELDVINNELVFKRFATHLNFIDYKSSCGMDHVNLKVGVRFIMRYVNTLIRKSKKGEVISEQFTVFPTLNEGERLFLLGMATGGIMEDPEIRLEGPYAIVIAKSEEEATSMYNETYNCDYYYGTCVGEITK